MYCRCQKRVVMLNNYIATIHVVITAQAHTQLQKNAAILSPATLSVTFVYKHITTRDEL